MSITYSYFRSNTEHLHGHGALSPLRIYSARIVTDKGIFRLPLAVLDQDDLFVTHTSPNAEMVFENTTRLASDGRDLNLSPYFPQLQETGFTDVLPPAARQYLSAEAGVSDSDIETLWSDITSYAYVDKASEQHMRSERHWDQASYETGSTHRLIFGTIDRQRNYNITRFLSKYIYDLDFSKYTPVSDGKPNQLLRQLLEMNASRDKATELLCFASVISDAAVRNIEIINPQRKSMCVRLDGVVDNKNTSYSTFKGTVKSEIPAYLVAYAKLLIDPEKEIAPIVNAINADTKTRHILCGHSYGAWLAHEVAQRVSSVKPQSYLYNPPSHIAEKASSAMPVRYENVYKVAVTPNSFVHTHPKDPVTYPSLKSLFSLSAHAITNVRHQNKMLELGKLGTLDQSYISDNIGLNRYPAWSQLLYELSFANSGTQKETALLDVVNARLGCVEELFSHPAFNRYLVLHHHDKEALREEAASITHVLGRVTVNVKDIPVAPIGGIVRCTALMAGLAASGVGSMIREWATAKPEPYVPSPNSYY